MTRHGDVPSDTLLQRQIILTGDQFRNGVTAPTAETVGTTPTIPVLRFDAIAELVSIFEAMPFNWDKTVDVQLVLIWSLVNAQSNGETLDVTMDYTAPQDNATGEGIAKTSTQVTGQVTVTTANGLAVGDLYTMTINLDRNDGDNPFSSADFMAMEFHLTNLTGVAAAHLVSGCINWRALH